MTTEADVEEMQERLEEVEAAIEETRREIERRNPHIGADDDLTLADAGSEIDDSDIATEAS